MHVIIIGNGIAGITTATELRKRDKKTKITVISGESEYFYSRPALMYIYMRDMKLRDTQPYEKKFFKKQKINLVKDWVTSIDFEQKRLSLEGSSDLEYDYLVLALGSKANKFGWPGQDLPGVQGFVNLQELEELERRTENMNENNRVVVVGGGLIGVEVAEMMARRNIPCTFLVREETFWNVALGPGEGRMIQEEILEHGIDLRMQTNLKEIRPGENGEVAAIQTAETEEVIDCQVVVLAAGVSPNAELVKNTALEVDRGIKVDKQMKTNIEGVYACGDVAQQPPSTDGGRPVIEALWYTGKMHGPVVAENILGGQAVYDRGIWYNSAKFFEIDYHTYGLVGHNLPGEKEWYFRVPGERKSIRIVHRDNKVIGFNLLGIRYRDAVCRQWIEKEKSLDEVINNLHEANFDGEFYQKYETMFKEEYFKGQAS